MLTGLLFYAQGRQYLGQAGLTPSLYSQDGLHRLAEAAGSVGTTVSVHLKIDTGMHRVGLDPGQAQAFVSQLIDSGLDLEGVWTHLAVADERWDAFTQVQLDRFSSVLAGLETAGMKPRIAMNHSAGAIPHASPNRYCCA